MVPECRNGRDEGALLTGKLEGYKRRLLTKAAVRQWPRDRPQLGRVQPFLTGSPNVSFRYKPILGRVAKRRCRTAGFGPVTDRQLAQWRSKLAAVARLTAIMAVSDPV